MDKNRDYPCGRVARDRVREPWVVRGGLEVKNLYERLVQDLIDLNNASPVRQGKPFTHFGKTFDQVAKDQASFLDRSDYICAYAGDELLGVVKLVYRGDVASILTFLTKKS